MIGDQVTFQCHTVLMQLMGMGQKHLPPKRDGLVLELLAGTSHKSGC